MQLPAINVTLALPSMTTLLADSALLSENVWVPELIVWFGTVVGFEHCAARTAASRLQAQNQSAGRTRILATRRDFDAAFISRTLIWLLLA